MSLKLVMILTILASVLSFGYFFSQNLIVTYPDGMSHLMIARRTCGHDPLQLGNVWLWLPHILLLPLVCYNNFLYSSGTAGSIIAMLSYVFATAYIYKTVFALTENKGAAFTGAFIFGANPNVLYMQSIPMTELLLLATTVASTYYLIKWNQTRRDIYLLGSSFAVMLAVTTRYEAWIFFGGMLASLTYSILSYKFGFWKAVAHLLFFAILPGGAIAGWIALNAVYFKDPLAFTRGEYAAPSNWVSVTEPFIGNLGIAFQTYLIATIHNVGLPILIMGCLALIYFLVSTRLRPDAFVILVPLGIFPFFVAMLYLGQRPLHVEEVTGDLYNLRFALQMVIPAALLIGYMARMKIITILVVVVMVAGILGSSRIITLDESIVFLLDNKTIKQDRVGYWFEAHYDEGSILMEVYGNEVALFRLGPVIEHVIWEGAYLKWDASLRDPKQQQIRWIYMRKGTGGLSDKVWKAFQEHPESLNNYRRVFQTNDVEIFRRDSG